jgi:TRAP transporter TAXI family solute receptor
MGAVLGLLLALPAAAQAPAESQFFRIGATEIDSPAFTVAGIVAGGLSNPPGARPCDRGGSCGVPGMIAVAQAIGDAPNAVDLVVRSRIESLLLPADEAVRISQNRQGRNGDARGLLRSVATVFVEALHIVVLDGAAARDPRDLKGRRIGLAGTEGSGLALARQALDKLGLTDPVGPLAPEEALLRLSDGRFDAVVMVATAPFDPLAEFARRTPIRLLELPAGVATALLSEHRYLAAGQLAAGSYAGVMPTTVVALPTQLFVSAESDPGLIYQVTRALWNMATQKMLLAGPAEARDAKLPQALAGITLPLHPGAERFYRESGTLIEGGAVDPPPAIRGDVQPVSPAPRRPG